MEFTKKEMDLLSRMINCYWNENNAHHADNLKDWQTTFSIVGKLNAYDRAGIPK